MNYPECEKLNLLANERRHIINFLEWLSENGLKIVKIETLEEEACSSEKMAHRFLGIDENKLERERVHMLEGLRIQNEHK